MVVLLEVEKEEYTLESLFEPAFRSLSHAKAPHLADCAAQVACSTQRL